MSKYHTKEKDILCYHNALKYRGVSKKKCGTPPKLKQKGGTKLPLNQNCFDIIDQEDKVIEDLLHVEGNIILTDTDFKQLSCSTIGYLQKFLGDPTSVYYQCDQVSRQVDRTYPIVRIPTGNVDYYVPANDLKRAIKHRPEWKFMTFDPVRKTGPLMSKATVEGGSYVSAMHCQQGSERQLFKMITYNLDEQAQQQVESGSQRQEREKNEWLDHHRRLREGKKEIITSVALYPMRPMSHEELNALESIIINFYHEHDIEYMGWDDDDGVFYDGEVNEYDPVRSTEVIRQINQNPPKFNGITFYADHSLVR